MNGRIKALVEAVRLLAAEPATQLDHLRGLGLPQHVDEIALEFDDIAAAADDMLQKGELDGNQFRLLKELDALLPRMSGVSKSQLWTAEALASSLEWVEVRRAAKKLLRVLC